MININFKQIIFTLFLLLNVWFLKSQEISIQPEMPCSLVDNKVTWNYALDDLKDALIVQSLIAEGRFIDVQNFLEEYGYSQIEENYYIKQNRMMLEELCPIIQIFNLEESEVNLGLDQIGTRLIFQTKPGESYTSQIEHNRIWTYLMSYLNPGLTYDMFKKLNEFQKEKGFKIEFKDKYSVSTLSPDGEAETYFASNFMITGKDNPQKRTSGIFLGPGSNLFVEIILKKNNDGDECLDKINFSTLILKSFKEKNSNNLDVEIFKKMNSLNEIIWKDKSSNPTSQLDNSPVIDSNEKESILEKRMLAVIC